MAITQDYKGKKEAIPYSYKDYYQKIGATIYKFYFGRWQPPVEIQE